MEKNIIFKNIRESLKDLERASGYIEKRMHREIILESLKILEEKINSSEYMEEK